MLARPEDYDAFVRAVREGKAELGWGYSDVRAWAKKRGWPTPLFGLKNALLTKMAESPQNFNDAMLLGCIDIYLPDAVLRQPQYTAFNLDRFRFVELDMEGNVIRACIVESDIASAYTLKQDEREVYSLLQGATKTIESGDMGRKVRKNRDQLRAAFDAIRRAKTSRGIPFDVVELEK